ncbi:MAG TPA: NAD-dependent epimerase/dehydratase family protein [Allosphingosinicella sp.]|jgi:uncharacterized protein YbjT (DUF2867 family)
MRVALIGGTGLVGSLLVPKLLHAGHDLHRLQRREGRAGEGATLHIAAPEDWPAVVRALRPEAAISTLGTTIRQAGSRHAFRMVDHDLVLSFAQAAREAGATRFASVSSVGANPKSKTFYLRTKGELDAALDLLGFHRLDILRPGLLLGARAESRPAERLAQLLSPAANLLLRGPLHRYAAIHADKVATALAATLTQEAPGRHHHENKGIEALADW